MKTNRFISLLLCVVMIMSLFTGLAGSASADDIITHEVQSGEILMKICEKYGLNYYNSKNAIMQLNGFTSEAQLARLSVGQKLKLPASNAAAGTVSTTTATVTTTTVGGTTLTTTSYVAGAVAGGNVAFYLTPYTVKAGDTLNKICNELGSNYYYYSPVIQGINALANPNSIQPGQVLLIPTASATGATSAVVGHVVQAGETMSSIANQYGLNYQVQRGLINGLNRRDNMDKIYVGQTVLIPRTAATSGSSVVTTTTSGSAAAATAATATSAANTGNYQISISATANGSPYAVVNNVQFATRTNAGETVNIVPSPKAGYAVRDIQVVRTDSGTDIPVANYSFTMPNSSVQVTVSYSRGFVINKVASPYGSFDTMIYGTNANTAFFGDEVTLAIYPKKGYNVKIDKGVYYQKNDLSMERVYVEQDKTDGLYKFKMPNYEIRLTVVFEISKYYSFNSYAPYGGGNVCFFVDGVATNRALEGQTVTMQMLPNPGWEFDSSNFETSAGFAQLVTKVSEFTKLNDTTYRFVMGSESIQSSWVTVVFRNRNTYGLSADLRGGHGSVSFQVVDGSYNILERNVSRAQAGKLVEIVFRPDNEWAFNDVTFMKNNSIQVQSGAQLYGPWEPIATRYIFKMPAEDVKIVAAFNKTGEIYYDLNLEYDQNYGTAVALQDGKVVSRAKADKAVTILVSAKDNYGVAGIQLLFENSGENVWLPNVNTDPVGNYDASKVWKSTLLKHAGWDTVRVVFTQYNEYTTVGSYDFRKNTRDGVFDSSNISITNAPDPGARYKVGDTISFLATAGTGFSVAEVWAKRVEDGVFIKMLSPVEEGNNTYRYSYTVTAADKDKTVQFVIVKKGEEPVHHVIPEYTIDNTSITNVGSEVLYSVSINDGPAKEIGPVYGMGANIDVLDKQIKAAPGAKVTVTIPKKSHKYLGAGTVLIYQVDTVTIRLSDYVLNNYKVLQDGADNFIYEFWYDELTDLNIMVNFKQIGTSNDATTDSGAVTGTPITVVIDGVTYNIASGEGTIITTPDKDATITIIGKVT